MRHSPHQLISGGGKPPYQGPSCNSEGAGSKEDGTHLLRGVLQPCDEPVTHPPWIGLFLNEAHLPLLRRAPCALDGERRPLGEADWRAGNQSVPRRASAEMYVSSSRSAQSQPSSLCPQAFSQSIAEGW